MNKSGRVGTYRTMPDWGSLAFSTTYGAAAGVMEYVAEGSKVGVGMTCHGSFIRLRLEPRRL